MDQIKLETAKREEEKNEEKVLAFNASRRRSNHVTYQSCMRLPGLISTEGLQNQIANGRELLLLFFVLRTLEK